MANHIATTSTASGTEIGVSNSALILSIRIFKLHNGNFPRTVYSNRVPMAGAIINITLKFIEIIFFNNSSIEISNAFATMTTS